MKKLLVLVSSLAVIFACFALLSPQKASASTGSGCPDAGEQIVFNPGGPICMFVYASGDPLPPGCTADQANNLNSAACQPELHYSIQLPNQSPTSADPGWVLSTGGSFYWNGPGPAPSSGPPSVNDEYGDCAAIQALQSGAPVVMLTSTGASTPVTASQTVVQNSAFQSAISTNIATCTGNGAITNTSSNTGNNSGTGQTGNSGSTSTTGSSQTNAKNPSISGVQGFNPGVPAAQAYTNYTALPNTYIVLYGTFLNSGNSVDIDNVPVAPSLITYQSSNQINVSLTGLANGSHSVIAINGLGISNAAQFSISTSTTSSSSSSSAVNPSIAGVQGYDPATKIYTNYAAVPGTYLVLYGTFLSSGNTIYIDNVPISASQVTYQSTNQINVFLTGVANGNHMVSVANGLGISNSVQFVIAITTPYVNPSVSNPMVITSTADAQSKTLNTIYGSAQTTIQNALLNYVQTSGISPSSSSLTAGVSGTAINNGPVTGGSCYQFTQTLQIGSTGSDLIPLEQALIADGELASSYSSQTYDATLATAVSAFQEKYATQILTPLGLTSGTGIVAAQTRAELNTLCLVPSTGSSSSSSSGSTTGTSPATATNFRYLKVSTTETGWVAWREIEIYDANGNKIIPASATASSVYSSDGTSLAVSSASSNAASNAIDGNPSTAWNAGETYPGCDWNHLTTTVQACLAANASIGARSAWITIDLGSVMNVSKIRLLQDSNEWNETITLSVSDDNSSFNQVAQRAATTIDPFLDNQWIEFPQTFQTFSAAPTATLTVNGSTNKDVSVYPGQAVVFSWTSSNADKVTFTTTCPGFQIPSTVANGKPVPSFGSIGGVVNLPIMGSKFNGEYMDLISCGGSAAPGGSVTYTASQQGSGQSASATVNIHLLPSPSTLPVGTGFSASPLWIAKTSSLSAQEAQVLSSYPVASTPVIKTPLPAGISASLYSNPPESSICDSSCLAKYSFYGMNVSVDPSVQPGFYVVEIDDSATGGFVADVPVIVTATSGTSFSDNP
jgi:hypothetical protein